MSSPLENQAKVWVQTISSSETLSAYQAVLQSLIAALQALWDALKVTWEIIKETGKLLWLFLCLGLVAFDWIWEGAKQLVNKAKGLTAEAGDPKSDTYLVDAGKALLEASKTSAARAVTQAREQLGLPTTDERNTATTVISQPSTISAAPPVKPAPAPVVKDSTPSPTSEKTEVDS